MAYILNIETSTKSTSVSIAKNGNILALLEEHDVVSHATKLTPFIQEVLIEAKVSMSTLDAIAVSIGPGSYTGLRIGLSTAKGLCYSLGIPLISISALECLAYRMQITHTKNKLFVSVMNSRKDEVYLCLVDSSLNILIKPTPQKVDENFLHDFIHEDIVIGGTGLEKIKTVTKHQNITFIEDLKFSAKEMVKPTFKLFAQGLFADLAYSEPNYLKPFIST